MFFVLVDYLDKVRRRRVNLAKATATLDLHHAAAVLSPEELAGELEILLYRLEPNGLRRVQQRANEVAWGHL